MNGKVKNQIIEELKNDKILRGLLGMSSSEIEIYFILIGNQMSVGDLAETLGIEKSSVYKCVKNLYHRKLLKRKKKSTENSRYVFNSVSLLHFRDLVEHRLKHWFKIIESIGTEKEK